MEGKNIEKKLQFSVNDIEHIRSTFVDRKTLVEKTGTTDEKLQKWYDNGDFPEPTYSTDDGKEWYPPYLVILIGKGLNNESSPREEFLKDAEKVLNKPAYVYRFGNVEVTGSHEDDAQKMWKDFKSGLYGACLKKPEPESILEKGELIKTIKELISNSDPTSTEWRSTLREKVNSLDTIEAQFTDYDRIRFGGTVSRDIFITNVKKQFSEVFSE
ncbi:MAG: DUF6058 family natural product biosynthesis protein [Cuniculiplasma sp.]